MRAAEGERDAEDEADREHLRLLLDPDDQLALPGVERRVDLHPPFAEAHLRGLGLRGVRLLPVRLLRRVGLVRLLSVGLRLRRVRLVRLLSVPVRLLLRLLIRPLLSLRIHVLSPVTGCASARESATCAADVTSPGPGSGPGPGLSWGEVVPVRR
ncbi:hypothetical protein GCM10018783_45430 [Streptomyces griseosporeus]|nr:hypothetical protein GCM10018783_45430 [Streptomyces griseosporeus]